jgi:hypothetical protein
MSEHKLVTLKIFDTEEEAGAAKSLLEAEGLVAFVVKSNVRSAYLAELPYLGAELRVPEDELEEAREILSIGASVEAGDVPEPEEDELPEDVDRPAPKEGKQGGQSREMPTNLVVLRAYENEIEAEMARGLLESAGITAFVLRENAGGWYSSVGAVGEIILLVAGDEVEAANEVLGEEQG